MAKLCRQQNPVYFLPAPTCSPVFLRDTSQTCILSFKWKQCNEMTRSIRELSMPSGGWVSLQLGEEQFGRRRKRLRTAFPSAEGFRQDTAKLSFRVQMQGTWPWLAPAGQQGSKSFQPFLQRERMECLESGTHVGHSLNTTLQTCRPCTGISCSE